MYPWDIRGTGDRKPTDEFTVPLWARFEHKDFYFTSHYQKDTKVTIVYIVPAEYFHKTGLMYDDSMPILHLLPPYLEEIMEGIYETSYNPDYVIHNLSTLGFSRSRHFDNLISRTSGISGGYSDV